MTTLASNVDVSATAARAGLVAGQRHRKGLFRRHPRLVIGGALVVLLIVLAIFAPLLTHYDPINGDISARTTRGGTSWRASFLARECRFR
jgi:peptide/nickel transport system permease protein